MLTPAFFGEQLMSLCIVVTGNPAEGFEHIGPFTQEHYAAEWADTWLPSLDWWVIPLTNEKEKENEPDKNE